jgi:uridine kinase
MLGSGTEQDSFLHSDSFYDGCETNMVANYPNIKHGHIEINDFDLYITAFDLL